MTSIACIWRLDGRPGARDDLERMQDALAPYGRDRTGRWDGGAVALGAGLAFRRPEDRLDRQPLQGGGGRYVLAADARIDNRPELAEALGLPAERASAMPDSAFILAAWERWGEGAIDRLVGDFAFILWDAQARVLHLARDPMGFRPLFYHAGPGRIAVATMPKGLHALPDVARAPDPDGVRDFLMLAPQRGPGTLFKDIRRVEQAGHVAVHADGRIAAREWYDWGAGKTVRFERPEDYAEALREIFDRAVADRMRGVERVGAHLSGGLDSAAVVSSAAIARARQGKGLTAYTSVPMPGAELEDRPRRFGDEGPQAALLAARYPNVEHVLVDAADRDIGDDLDGTFFAWETPALNLANMVWASAINRAAAARGETVLLMGQYGNMTISHTGVESLHGYLRRMRPDLWFRETRKLVRRGAMRWRGALVAGLGPWLPSPWVSAVRRLAGHSSPRPEDYSPLRPEIVRDPGFRRHLAEIGYDPDFGPMRSRVAMARLVLTRMDVMGMMVKGDIAAFNVELCDPTSDRRVLDFCLAAPDAAFLRDGEQKWVYRRAFAGRVPDETLARRETGYQCADWAPRLRRAQARMAQEVERAKSSPAARELIDLETLAGLAASAPEGPVTQDAAVAYRIKLLRGASVAHFLRKLDGGNA